LSDQPRFERTAERYAREAQARDWSEVIELCRPAAGDAALDVAAGPGMLSSALLGRVGRAVAFDASPALLAHAPAGVEAVEGDASAMPFADRSFDIVTCVNGLHHLDDPAAGLAEMARVLAPGGRLVLQDYIADPDPERARRWDEIERLRADDHRRLLAEGEAGAELARRGLRSWQWDAPATPGLFNLEVKGPSGTDTITLRAFVMVPAAHVKDGYLNGYRIGTYPDPPYSGDALYRLDGTRRQVEERQDVIVGDGHLALDLEHALVAPMQVHRLRRI